MVASARQRLSAPAGFTYTYPKSVKAESEINGAYAQENFARSGDSALSMDDGSNPSLISQPAATRQMAGRNRPVERLVAPESVAHPRAGTQVPRHHRRHRSCTPAQGQRAATPPIPPWQRSRIPPVPLEPTPSESVSQRGSSRRSAFAPVRGGGQIAYHREGSTRGVNVEGG